MVPQFSVLPPPVTRVPASHVPISQRGELSTPDPSSETSEIMNQKLRIRRKFAIWVYALAQFLRPLRGRAYEQNE
jgi:hypothetical protein